jgi:RNA polymerase sigma factor (sigma-70 family)
LQRASHAPCEVPVPLPVPAMRCKGVWAPEIEPVIVTAGSIAAVVKAKDDETDFVAFFYEVEMPVRQFAARIAPAGVDPEDLAAEGLARAFAKWPKIRRLPYRRAWVFRVTANIALDGARRRAAADRRSARDLPTVPASSPEDDVSRRETLRAALASLPRCQREAVSLRYLGDLSVDESASAMSVSAETVKTHCERGLSELRRLLGRSFEETKR